MNSFRVVVSIEPSKDASVLGWSLETRELPTDLSSRAANQFQNNRYRTTVLRAMAKIDPWRTQEVRMGSHFQIGCSLPKSTIIQIGLLHIDLCDIAHIR
jgi:hypothetical protein